MTGDAFAFVSGPAMVDEFTGIRIGVQQLGGSAIHARSSGLCAIEAASTDQALEHVAHLLEPPAGPYRRAAAPRGRRRRREPAR